MNLQWLIVLGLALYAPCSGIFEGCDFYQELVPGRSYYIYSPEYPEKYPPGKACRWYAVSPPNTQIFLSCDEFYIPPSQECRLDRLVVSRSGRIDLADAESFCGDVKPNLVSNENRLNVVLLTVPYSPRGAFLCRVGVKATRPPPDPACTCGHTNTMRIVGGTETGVNEYPMMAGLIDGVKKELFCGATIISQKHALTAAHCLRQKVPRDVGLLVGEHDLSVGNDTSGAAIYRAERFYVHPNYNTATQKNDVALVAVRGWMVFRREVGAACLPFLNVRDSFAGETVYALGWGTTSFLGPTSDKLLKAPLDVITLQQCKPTYGDLVSDKQMCTYKEDKDACQSDSGGPLLWKDPHNGLIKVLGIISYGIQCATPNPSVNTRVTSYLDWIKDTTGEEYCVV